MKSFKFILLTLILFHFTWDSFAQETCCQEGTYVLNGGNISTQNFPSVFTGCVEVYGNLIIDNQQYFSGAQVYMHPYSSITVLGGSRLSILSQTKIQSCDEVWFGITATSGAVIIMDNSFIMDAISAIKAEDGSNLFLQSNEFNRNLIGLDIPGPNLSDPVNLIFPIIDNKFLGTQNLKSPLTGASTIGIQVKGNLIVSENNEFESLFTGILASCGVLSVTSCQFFDGDPLGTGISGNTLSLLDVRGNSSFTNLNAGILTETSNASIEGNSFQAVNFGITGRGGYPGGSYDVLDNYLMVNNAGISLRNFYDDVNIQGNFIEREQLNIGAFTGVYITNSEGQISVLLNDISQFGSASIGIYLEASSGVSVKECNIISKNNQNFDFGIQVFGGRKNTIIDNSVTGPTSSGSYGVVAGLQVFSSRVNYISCNQFTNTSIGMNFNGYCDFTEIRKNNMRNHSFGLQLGSNAIVGVQEHKFNNWFGSYGSYGAYHNSIDKFIVDLSAFTVSTTGPPINPGSVYPDPNDPISPNIQWFYVDPYQGDIVDCEGIIVGFGEDENDKVARYSAVANNNIYQGTEQAAHFYNAKRSLYTSLEEEPNLIQTYPDLNTFYQGNTNSNIGKLDYIQKEIFTLTEIDQATQYSVTNINYNE